MSIVHLTSLQQLSSILSSSGNKLTVIDFHATWCGPCHAIAPIYEKLSKEYKGVNFLKCDVDATPDVAKEYSVRAMPTFVFIKGKVKVDQVQGANPQALESTLKTHAGSGTASTGTFTGKGQTLGGSSTANSSGTSAPASGLTNLDPQMKVFLGLIAAYLVFWYFTSST